MLSHDPNVKSNGGPVRDPGGSVPGPVGIERVGQELAELARTLSGPLHRLSVRVGDCEIQVEWDHPEHPGTAPLSAPAPIATPVQDGPDDKTIMISSPLVGTYFAAAAPGAEPFVRVGQEVERGQTLAIVEAMKLMNAVLADEPGVVTDVLVADGQSVEFDQPLIMLRPTDGEP